jgi:hypothetical protein
VAGFQDTHSSKDERTHEQFTEFSIVLDQMTQLFKAYLKDATGFTYTQSNKARGAPKRVHFAAEVAGCQNVQQRETRSKVTTGNGGQNFQGPGKDYEETTRFCPNLKQQFTGLRCPKVAVRCDSRNLCGGQFGKHLLATPFEQISREDLFVNFFSTHLVRPI